MKRLNKIQNIVFITGAVLLLIGAATFFTGWLYAFYLYTVGACAFAAMQLRAGYEGDNFVIRRLRGQQVIGALLLVCTAFFMAMRIFDFGFAQRTGMGGMPGSRLRAGIVHRFSYSGRIGEGKVTKKQQ